MHFVAVGKVLVLVAVANGSPIIATRIFGTVFSGPLDGNVRFIDGRPLFGPSKTIRGIIVSLPTTALIAPLLGLELRLGLLIGATAMAGDLLSSFLKRRLSLPPSSRATGLDQIPESLLPLLASGPALSLSAIDIVLGCLVFFFGELLLSNLFFKLRLRNRPY
ncbi:MAG: CDP-archaeol synthase [Pseudolabrys sp.]